MEEKKHEEARKPLSVDEEKLQNIKLDETSSDNRDLNISPTIQDWEDCVGINFIMGR